MKNPSNSEKVIEVIKQIGYDFCELYFKVGTILTVVDSEYDNEMYRLKYPKYEMGPKTPDNTFIIKASCKDLPNQLILK